MSDNITNVEIKAQCSNNGRIRDILKSERADFKGIDHQIDTYFKVNYGRLKLREGNIENNLIYYERENQAGLKQSKIILFKAAPESTLKAILENSCDVLAIVDKMREIYFIENVKFHIDIVKNLGEFIEIEAIDSDGSIGKNKLSEQCNMYMRLFEINESDLISDSYSDLILSRK